MSYYPADEAGQKDGYGNYINEVAAICAQLNFSPEDTAKAMSDAQAYLDSLAASKKAKDDVLKANAVKSETKKARVQIQRLLYTV
jgi:hypothetical protein